MKRNVFYLDLHLKSFDKLINKIILLLNGIKYCKNMFVFLLALVTLFGILLSSTITMHYILAVSSSLSSPNSLLPKGIQGDVHSGTFKISDRLKEIRIYNSQ